MPRYSVIITRDVTESTIVQVEAETPEQAETAAFKKLFESTDAEWEIASTPNPHVCGTVELRVFIKSLHIDGTKNSLRSQPI